MLGASLMVKEARLCQLVQLEYYVQLFFQHRHISFAVDQVSIQPTKTCSLR